LTVYSNLVCRQIRRLNSQFVDRFLAFSSALEFGAATVRKKNTGTGGTPTDRVLSLARVRCQTPASAHPAKSASIQSAGTNLKRGV
jgi:hypothetical protein